METNFHKEACRVIGRLMSSDPDFGDCEAAVELIKALSQHIEGPEGFETWKDAAVAERLRRVRAETELAEIRRAVPQANAEQDAITDTQRMDFQQANPRMYFNVDKRGKYWRFGHFSNYPQDEYPSAREAIDAAIRAASNATSPADAAKGE